MIRAPVLVLALLLAPAPAAPAAAQVPERIVAGLSQTQVAITTNFAGSEILVYGAVRRDAPPPGGGALQVIVTVAGPPVETVVRRRDRVAGIWVNNAAVTIDRAPSFYAIATTRPLDRILRATDDLRHRISIPRTIRAVGIAAEAEGSPDFLEALIRLQTRRGNYVVDEGSVTLTDETLFRADVALPANLVEGTYAVRIFLLRGGRVIDAVERPIAVRKTGLERIFTQMARNDPLAYGVLSLVLAVAAGWGASAAFRLVRP